MPKHVSGITNRSSHSASRTCVKKKKNGYAFVQNLDLRVFINEKLERCRKIFTDMGICSQLSVEGKTGYEAG